MGYAILGFTVWVYLGLFRVQMRRLWDEICTAWLISSRTLPQGLIVSLGHLVLLGGVSFEVSGSICSVGSLPHPDRDGLRVKP